MSRPKIPGNLRSRVLYTRDAYHTLTAALHMWAVDCNASLHAHVSHEVSAASYGISAGYGHAVSDGAFGVLKTSLNDAHEESDNWHMPAFFNEPFNIGGGEGIVNWTADVETTDEPVLATYQLIRLDKAAVWIQAEFNRVILKYDAAMIRKMIPGKTGRYRATCHWIRSKVRLGVYLKLAIERLKQVCLTQKRRAVGPQIIQTRKPINAPYYTSFTFSGTHAIRLPQGRPALSEAEWIRREVERRKKRRKTDTRHKDRKEIRAPRPKNGRPSRLIETQIQTHKPAVQQYLSKPLFEPDGDFDWSEIGKEFGEELKKEVAKQVGENIGNWIGDKFKEVTGL